MERHDTNSFNMIYGNVDSVTSEDSRDSNSRPVVIIMYDISGDDDRVDFHDFLVTTKKFMQAQYSVYFKRGYNNSDITDVQSYVKSRLVPKYKNSNSEHIDIRIVVVEPGGVINEMIYGAVCIV